MAVTPPPIAPMDALENLMAKRHAAMREHEIQAGVVDRINATISRAQLDLPSAMAALKLKADSLAASEQAIKDAAKTL